MNKKLIPLVLISASVITACDKQPTTDGTSTTPVATVSKEDAVASVNGVYISKAALTTLEQEVAQRSRGRSFPKEKLLEELIQREILQQEAINKQLDKTAEYIERIDTIKKSLLAQVAVQDFLKANPLTDADIEAEYKKNVGDSGTEYKARHILVKTEEEAKQLIEELKKGADFIELAKSKSTGPSGPKGGDLGWFASTQMVPPFSEATIALKDGEFTTKAVQTQFGWHIILREGSRAQTPPPFESVKEQIRPMLQRKKTQDFLDNLRAQAKVETFLKEEPKKVAVPKPAEDKSVDSATKAADAVKDKAETAAKENVEATAEKVKTEVTEKASKMKEAISDASKNAAEKVETKAKDATAIVTKTIEKAKEVVKEKTSDTATKAVEILTQ